MNEGINWSQFTNKKVGILGAGKENISLVGFLIDANASVTICERNLPDDQRKDLEELAGLSFQLGEDHLRDIGKFDVVFRSPGLPIKTVTDALGQSHSTEINSAMNLFVSGYREQIIGVTGTKGKGTTATMIFSIIQASGRHVILAGNIGVSIYDHLSEISPQTLIILELSSFQLEDMKASPTTAVLVPISPDHLEPLSDRSPNFHPTFEKYIEAKSNLVRFQTSKDSVVYPAENQTSRQVANLSPGEKYSVGPAGSYSVFLASGELISQDEEINLLATGIRGEHLLLDAALAATTSKIIGINSGDIMSGLQQFRPLPHRMEELEEREGVRFMNDSYATTPESSIAALSAFDSPVLLIAGGSRKGADFTEFSQAVSRGNVKAVALIGQEAVRIQNSLMDSSYRGKIIMSADLDQACRELHSLSKKGDTILLSPACASKDMFVDAADRGNQFKQIVSHLNNE